MGKIIFWIVVIFVVLFVLRLVNAGQGAATRRATGDGAQRAGREPMVRCVRCGVFLPRADALPVAGRVSPAATRAARSAVDGTPDLLR